MNCKEDLIKLLDKDKKFVWHALARYQKDGNPLIITGAEGVWLTDIEGNRYLDGMSGLWCVNVGYGREELAKAAYDQLVDMPYYPLTKSHVPAIELGEKLHEWLEDEYIIFYSNSGSEANETAFKVARQIHHQSGHASKYKFISRYRAYHGNSFGALAATGQPHRKYRYEPLASGFLHVTPPDCYRCPFGKAMDTCDLECADAVEQKIVWENPDTVAGVIMEAIITGGGVFVTHEGYFKRIEDICRRHHVLMIADEVICGFGRTGERFGFQHYGVNPDIITMAKGITSAYFPLSATLVKRSYFELFKASGEYEHFRHVNTYGGHPAGCAVAVKNVELMEDENLVANSAVKGKELSHALKGLLDHPKVGDMRWKGLLLGIELVEDRDTKQPISDTKMNQVVGRCLKQGLIVGKNTDTVAGYNNILAVAPPLTVTSQEVDIIAKAVIEGINTLA